MVAISLTHDSAKEMANRLRQFLAAGGTSIKQTHAYEALAKTLGYRDWNTLVGALQSTGSVSQEMAVEEGTTASARSPTMPAALLLIDRHAMAAHGVTMAHIESAFRREFPGCWTREASGRPCASSSFRSGSFLRFGRQQSRSRCVCRRRRTSMMR
jgi:hypothetical protein